MAHYSSRSTDCLLLGRWTLAGANSHGIVYGVRIDVAILQVKLWSYNDFRRSCKVLAVSELPSAPRQVRGHYLASAVYDERLQRVDIFVECRTSSYILRFIVEPEPRFHSILSANNDGNIRFDGFTGPSLHYCCGRLIVTGSKRADRGEVFRIFQVLINEEERAFRLVPGWNSDRSIIYKENRVVTFGSRLLVLDAGWKGFWFTPDTREEILRWPDPTLFRDQLNFETRHSSNRFALCPSLNSSDAVWIVPQLSDTQEVTVTPDRLLATRRSLKYYGLGVDSSTGMTKSAAASTSHMFWIRHRDQEIESVPFGVPALEYLCLSKLYSTMEAFRRCTSEKDAILMGLPITTWRRYCR